MKGMKKLLSILMVLTLVLSLGASALAANVSISQPSDGLTHTYKAYQIFTGTDQVAEEGAISNLAWGNGINVENFVAALIAGLDEFTEENTKTDGVCDAQKVAKVLSTLSDDSAQLKKVAELARQNVNEAAGVDITNSSQLGIGYYVIVDTTNVDGKDAVKNEVVLEVTQDVNVTFKADKPSSEKFVKDSNDTTGDKTEWQKSGDWDIGDDVPFQLEATIPAGTVTPFINAEKAYKLVFHDTQDAGLTFDKDSVKVYLNGSSEALSSDLYTVTFNEESKQDDGCTFEVTITDVTKIPGFDDAKVGGNVITVEYESKLNENAVIGNHGNKNEMDLEFSNDYTSEDTGMTPPSNVVVFTYDMDVNKTDGDGKKLEGAEFKLYKEVPAGTLGAFQLTKKGDKAEDEHASDPKLHDDKYYIDYTNDLEQDADDPTVFTAKGLDDGNYVIVETKTPTGYNTADPIEFTLEAIHEANDGNTETTVQSITDFTVDMTKSNTDEAIIDTSVKNFSGATLPETGGIGTTIFYIAGAILVAGAVIILVTKKRVSGAEK